MDLAAIHERTMATPLVSCLLEAIRQRSVMVLLWLADTRKDNVQQRIKEM